MLGVDDPETFLRIRDKLLAQCDQVEELQRHVIVRTWRDWHAAYPLAPKPHHSILKSDIVSRLCAIVRSLKGKHARRAYEQREPVEIFVLCVDALVGWKCKCARVPRLYEIDASLIVTSAEFAWTFGSHGNAKRGGLFGGPVFIEPEMLPEALL